MADFSKTISNSVNLFGGSPTSLWNAWNWNAFRWGEGTADLPVAVMHLIGESLSLDSGIGKFDTAHLISESLSPDSAMDSEYLTDGSGYNYVFPSDVTNHQDQAIASYTVGSNPSNSWSSAAAGGTVWS